MRIPLFLSEENFRSLRKYFILKKNERYVSHFSLFANRGERVTELATKLCTAALTFLYSLFVCYCITCSVESKAARVHLLVSQ